MTNIFNSKKGLDVTGIGPMIGLVLGLLVLVIMFFGIKGYLEKGHSPAENVQEENAIGICIDQVEARYDDPEDVDEDGIPDLCDVCVIDWDVDDAVDKKEAIKANFNTAFPEGNRRRNVIAYLLPSQNTEENDKDGDGIYDGCDSGIKDGSIWDKISNAWIAARVLGFIGPAREKECKVLAGSSEANSLVPVITKPYGYITCHIKYS